jgi:hypothetical protein
MTPGETLAMNILGSMVDDVGSRHGADADIEVDVGLDDVDAGEVWVEVGD